MRQDKIKIVVLMIVAYAFLLIGVINSYPMHTTTDELGTIVGAAKLAGLDWSGVISTSGYYGFGYYSLFFWIFKITDSPFIIYRSIITITILLRVLIIPISYSILKNFLGVEQERYLFSVSFLMPFLHTSTVGGISNEDVLAFLIWLIMWNMCASISAKCHKKTIKYYVLVILLCFYSLFIHTRALTLIIALEIVYIVYGIINKKKTVFISILGLPIAYAISKILVSFYQKNIYGVSGNAVRNGGVIISNNFNLFDKNVWDIWFRMLVGILSTENILIGGILVLGIVVTLFYVKHLITVKRSVLSSQGNMLLATMILCIGATIMAFLVSNWFEGMRASWGNTDISKDYAYKGLMYVRYWDIYVPPFILSIFAVLTKIQYKKIINVSIVATIGLYILYIQNLLPLVKNNDNCAGFLYGVGHYHTGIHASSEYYFKCILISLSIIMSQYIIVHTKYKEYVIFISILFIMSFHFNKQTEYDFDIKNRVSSKILASYDMKCKLEKQGVNIGTIYLNDETLGNDNNWKIYSVAQFYFNRYTLQTELPEKLEKNDIIISTNKSEKLELQFHNLNRYELDDNEVWYTYMEL